jgi:hypothetical protein
VGRTYLAGAVLVGDQLSVKDEFSMEFVSRHLRRHLEAAVGRQLEIRVKD